MISLTIDGKTIEVQEGITILEAARSAGIYVPTLCAHPDLPPKFTEEPLFTRDYNLCIGCQRCVRACRDVRGVDALGEPDAGGRRKPGACGRK